MDRSDVGRRGSKQFRRCDMGPFAIEALAICGISLCLSLPYTCPKRHRLRSGSQREHTLVVDHELPYHHRNLRLRATRGSSRLTGQDVPV